MTMRNKMQIAIVFLAALGFVIVFVLGLYKLADLYLDGYFSKLPPDDSEIGEDTDDDGTGEIQFTDNDLSTKTVRDQTYQLLPSASGDEDACDTDSLRKEHLSKSATPELGIDAIYLTPSNTDEETDDLKLACEVNDTGDVIGTGEVIDEGATRADANCDDIDETIAILESDLGGLGTTDTSGTESGGNTEDDVSFMASRTLSPIQETEVEHELAASWKLSKSTAAGLEDFASAAEIILELEFSEGGMLLGAVREVTGLNTIAKGCPREICFHIKLVPSKTSRMSLKWIVACNGLVEQSFTIHGISDAVKLSESLCVRLYGRRSQIVRKNCYGQIFYPLMSVPIGERDVLPMAIEPFVRRVYETEKPAKQMRSKTGKKQAKEKKKKMRVKTI